MAGYAVHAARWYYGALLLLLAVYGVASAAGEVGPARTSCVVTAVASTIAQCLLLAIAVWVRAHDFRLVRMSAMWPAAVQAVVAVCVCVCAARAMRSRSSPDRPVAATATVALIVASALQALFYGVSFIPRLA